jgi:hypothetical protein
VRRPGATRQRIHCRARGARQRTSARQRALEAHGKDPCTALSFFPVVPEQQMRALVLFLIKRCKIIVLV